MSQLEYYILDPTKNITALVTTPVDVSVQPSAAKEIMKNEPDCEQVGFVSFSENGAKLRMAGGEFCGNATMSAAVLFAMLEDITEKADIPVEICSRSISVTVTPLPGGGYTGCVEMPSPGCIVTKTLTDGEKAYTVPVVCFDGTYHIINNGLFSVGCGEKNIRAWCEKLGCDCLGIMNFDDEKQFLTPLVLVRTADTLFRENSCASGTTALGAYLASSSADGFCGGISQPGGILTVSAFKNGKITLTGNVRVIRKNTAKY